MLWHRLFCKCELQILVSAVYCRCTSRIMVDRYPAQPERYIPEDGRLTLTVDISFKISVTISSWSPDCVLAILQKSEPQNMLVQVIHKICLYTWRLFFKWIHLHWSWKNIDAGQLILQCSHALARLHASADQQSTVWTYNDDADEQPSYIISLQSVMICWSVRLRCARLQT